MISLKPTCETDTFESWWRRLIEVAANYGVKVKPIDRGNPVWRKFYDDGLTPGAAYVKALKNKTVRK
jgi:hypothetical protein